MSRWFIAAALASFVVVGCTGAPDPMPDKSWLRGTHVDAAPGRAFVASPESTTYWEIQRQGDELRVSNTSLGSGITPIPYKGEAPARLAWEVRGELLQEGIDGGWGVEFGYRKGGSYRVLLYASGRFCVDRAFGDYPEFIHCVTRLPAIRTGEGENRLGLELDGTRVRIHVNGHLALEFNDERLLPGTLALAVAGAGATVLFKETDLRDLSRATP